MLNISLYQEYLSQKTDNATQRAASSVYGKTYYQ